MRGAFSLYFDFRFSNVFVLLFGRYMMFLDKFCFFSMCLSLLLDRGVFSFSTVFRFMWQHSSLHPVGQFTILLQVLCSREAQVLSVDRSSWCNVEELGTARAKIASVTFAHVDAMSTLHGGVLDD